jgi:alpha-2-macroglobulin
MRTPRLAVVSAISLGVLALGSAAGSDPDARTLGVLRVEPGELAEPDASILITFDRPVAGGLDDEVDAAAIFRIEPRVEGRVEWRDPLTLRFTPARPLEPGATYRVTLAADFVAMDGSRLPRAHSFQFRVERGRVLTGFPVGLHEQPRFLDTTPRFDLLLSSAVDPALLAAHAQLALQSRCGGPQTVRLRVLRQRAISDDDPEWFRYFGVRGNDPARDLRRVAELEPERPLPRGCTADLVVPASLDAPGGETHRWRFATYGPLRLVRAGCRQSGGCPTGPVEVTFSTPVRGADVLRHVRIEPERAFVVRDTAEASDRWILEARLEPRRSYTVTVDAALTDVFGQRLETAARAAFATPGLAPSAIYPYGRMIVEREGFRTLAVQHVNVDTLEVVMAAVPDSLEGRFLARRWGEWADLWKRVEPTAVRHRVAVRNEQDRSSITGVRLPAHDARRAGPGTLLALQVRARGVDTLEARQNPLTLLQVTDLAVHARIGEDQGTVWVTGVGDGRPRAGAEVRLHEVSGRVRATATTDAQGVATFAGSGLPWRDLEGCEDDCDWGFEGYVSARLGDDRAVVGINEYDPDLSPWQFGVGSAWRDQRVPAAGAVFTERGIYRPGEPVHAKAIVRRGPLGALRPPARGDTVRWQFTDREGRIVVDTAAALSRFGTAQHTFHLPADLPLGDYGVRVQLRDQSRWITVGEVGYQVAEYRPPEFLVEVATTEQPRFAGDRLTATVGGRYLFGAPMAQAPVRWLARQRPASSGEITIPGAEGYYVGETESWWNGVGQGMEVIASGVDTLDARGHRDLVVALGAPPQGRPARLSIEASVVDANRQTVTGATSVLVHPADFYIGARPEGRGFFWNAGTPVRVGVIAVRPDGRAVQGVTVRGAVVRREWHRVRRQRGGAFHEVGEWVADTVATCAVTTGARQQACGFTPPSGGSYTVTFTAIDAQGRTATTSFARWSFGPDWVPWNDESKFKMDVIPDRPRYDVGDEATVLIASPFTDAEAWVTVERERIIEQRRVRLTSGTTELKLRITEAHAPNAFVSVVVVRGRSAAPGTVDDPGRPTMRVGYAELRVTPEVKRLSVQVQPLRDEYRPGDSARIRVRVRNHANRPEAAEVTLWAVDEGVLALTGYRTPDPLDLLYQPRGVGMRLASNLVAVAAQVPEGQKGARHPGGSGGQDLLGVLRSRFRPTAFFLGTIETNRRGEAVVTAQLPDNITTFRVMAVAVTEGDRYGHGESKLLATRPLIARPALPRFLREGDDLAAGVVVNHRFGRDVQARVTAQVRGATLEGPAEQTLALLAGRGAESRFRFHAPLGDSATFRFTVTGGGQADAVEVRVPVRAAQRPVTHAAAGLLRDTVTVEFLLPADIDPARSRLEVGFGTSPLAMIQGLQRQIEVYPYACTEQIASQVLPLILLHRAGQARGQSLVEGDPRVRIEQVVRLISRRQRGDGGIGLWSASDWTSPWLTAYAGRVLLEARGAGVAVSDSVLAGIAGYLGRSLREPAVIRLALDGRDGDVPAVLAERLAAADLLSRLAKPEVPAENVLVGQAARLSWEDRLLLAEMLARRGAAAPARQLLASAWDGVQVRGTRAVLPAHAYRQEFRFASHVRPTARLLTATLAIQPDHPRIGTLVETLVQQGRAEAARPWTTQDYGWAVLALANYELSHGQVGERAVRLRHGGRVVSEIRAQRSQGRDSATALTGLLTNLPDGRRTLRLSLEAAGSGPPVFYQLTVREIALRPPVAPLDRGIVVERWYESLETRRPVTTVREGEVVRVRLRITVPEDRHMVVLDDPLPSGLEAVDLTLRTVSPFGADPFAPLVEEEPEEAPANGWRFGRWDSGLWSPFDHSEIRDDRVIYFARVLWRGTYNATYLARATTAGRFTSAPAFAEEMYNPTVHGRSGGGVFSVNGAGGQR